MSDTPFYLDLGAHSVRPDPVVIAPKPRAPESRASPLPVAPPRPTTPAPILRATPRGDWRGDPVVKEEVMKPLCPQCGAQRITTNNAMGLILRFEVWSCPDFPEHCVQTWPRGYAGSAGR